MTILDKHTDADFIDIVNNSYSLYDVNLSLGYRPSSLRTTSPKIKERMATLGVELNYKLNPNRIPDEEYYVNGTPRTGIRERVIKDNHIPYICACCNNIGEWNGQQLSLQLDHIDGDSNNNELTNLRWLCPNCHTQTSTYGSKNTSTNRSNTYRSNKEHICVVCGTLYKQRYRGQKACSSSCSGVTRRTELPVGKRELYSLIKEHGFSAVGRMYGVTDNGVRAWCKRYNLPTRYKDYS